MPVYRTVFLALAAFFLAPFAEAATPHCVFHRDQNGFQGSCGSLFDGTPVLTLARAHKIASGVWCKRIHPREPWAGVITGEFAKYPQEKDPVELELYANGLGILWNRADNRRCRTDAKTWSIYCAIEKATIEVTGGFHHRRPALEVVRVIIDERSAGRPYHHWLMELVPNNRPAATGIAQRRGQVSPWHRAFLTYRMINGREILEGYIGHSLVCQSSKQII